MKLTLLSLALLTGFSTSAMANDNAWEKEAMDAWIDGKAEATLLFNSNLNSFDINTDVKMGTVVSGLHIDVDVDNRKVTLNGKVNSEAERDLAPAIAKNTKDVDSVNDKLVLTQQSE